MKDINHFCTEEIVCPYCGHEFDNSCEYSRESSSGIENCEQCNKEFRWYAEYEVSYTTTKNERS